MSQPATPKKKTAKASTVDQSFGFPGRMPKAGSGKDQSRFLAFFTEYVKDANARAAARRAGFSEKWAKQYSYKHLKENADYVKWLQMHSAQQVIKQIVIEQDVVLQEIARIGMLNEYDYLVIEAQPDKADIPQAPKVRRKRLDELSREQMTAIKVFRRPGGALDYMMRDKEGKLTELAKHVGLLNEKIILERRSVHYHRHDYTGVPIDELERLEELHEKLLIRYGKGSTLESPE